MVTPIGYIEVSLGVNRQVTRSDQFALDRRKEEAGQGVAALVKLLYAAVQEFDNVHRTVTIDGYPNRTKQLGLAGASASPGLEKAAVVVKDLNAMVVDVTHIHIAASVDRQADPGAKLPLTLLL